MPGNFHWGALCVLRALSCQSLSFPGHRQTSVRLVLQGLGWLPLLFGPYKLQRARGRGCIPASLLMSLETSQMFHWWCGLRSCCWRKLPGCCLTAVPLHHTALGLSIICPYLLGQRPSLDPRLQDNIALNQLYDRFSDIFFYFMLILPYRVVHAALAANVSFYRYSQWLLKFFFWMIFYDRT